MAVLFEANFYRAANRDLASFNDAQALSHFQTYGLSEGRAFSPFVDLNFYRASNSDLGSFDNRQLFDHLQTYGIAEGRRFSPLVNLNFYRAYNSDLASFNNEQLFDHLHNYGEIEGRRFSPLVDLNFYRAYNGDLSSFNNEQLFDHLVNYGETEGRRFSPFIDLNIYRVANPDLFAKRFDNKQLLEHLIDYGIGEGRRFSVSFDSNYYRNANPDLASLNNSQLLEHFGRYGLAEGRASSESFNVQFYLNYNTDLKAANFNNQQAQQHFEIYGFREGRTGALSREILPIDPGNTLDSAFNLGILNRQSSIKGFIGANDRDDYYRITLANTAEFNLNLGSDRAYADIIFDANGNGQYDAFPIIASNGAFVTSSESVGSTYKISGSQPISRTLGAGTYYIHVYTDASASDSNYTLNLSESPTPSTLPTDPGDGLKTAYDLNLTSGTSNVGREFIGTTDKEDYYSFTLTDTTNISLDFSGFTEPFSAGLYYDLYNTGYINLVRSLDGNDFIAAYSTSDRRPITETLGAGTYYIRVTVDDYSYSFNTPTNTTNYSTDSINQSADNVIPDYYANEAPSNTNYSLSLSATPATTTPSIPDPGDTLITAYNVGLLSGDRNFTQYVGVVDKVDYYRFILDQTSNVNFNLKGLNDRVDLVLIYDKNSNSQIDYQEFLTPVDGSSYPRSFSETLNAGTYYVEVLEYSSQYNTYYTLDLSAT